MLLVLVISSVVAGALLYICYAHIGVNNVKSCVRLFATANYWKPAYNKIEAAAWFTKALIIMPALVFGKQFWWLYIFSLTTSLLLIWASMKKLLPTLLAFNSLWVFISVAAIAKHFLLEGV